MATVKVFRSTDIGAPVLSNLAGSLISVLDACLVNGLSTQSVTSITRSGATATVTKIAHGYRAGDTVTISGANETDYNITATITNVTINTFDYTVANSPATPATGTILVKKTGAGWTKPFSSTNLAAYRMGGGNQHYLDVDGTSTNDTKVRGYETMSAVGTGTGDFPTAAQQAAMYWWKATGSPRDWIIVASDRLLYFWNDSDATTVTSRWLWIFGQIKSYKSGDAYGTILTGALLTTHSSTNYTAVATLETSTGTIGANKYMARTQAQTGASIQIGTHSDYSKLRTNYSGSDAASTGIQYPNPTNASIYINPVYLHEVSTNPIIRGEIPGLWCLCHQGTNFNHGDVIIGAGAQAGKTFEMIQIYANSARAFWALETSDTWST